MNHKIFVVTLVLVIVEVVLSFFFFSKPRAIAMLSLRASNLSFSSIKRAFFISHSSFSKIIWGGFSDRAKQIFKSDTINITIRSFSLRGEDKINKVYSNENVEISIGVPFYKVDQFDVEHYESGWGGGHKMTIVPDIIQNKIYEIVSYDLKTCTWVEE